MGRASQPGRFTGASRADLLRAAAVVLLVAACGPPTARESDGGSADRRDSPAPDSANATIDSVSLEDSLRSCNSVESGIAVRVQTPDGAPVNDASVTVHDLLRDSVVRRLDRSLLPDGGYVVLDGTIAKGDPTRYRVTAERGERRAEGVLLVGTDPTGCRIALLDGPHVLVLR